MLVSIARRYVIVHYNSQKHDRIPEIITMDKYRKLLHLQMIDVYWVFNKFV